MVQLFYQHAVGRFVSEFGENPPSRIKTMMDEYAIRQAMCDEVDSNIIQDEPDQDDGIYIQLSEQHVAFKYPHE